MIVIVMKTVKYSLEEVKAANLDVKVLRFNHVDIDTRRGTTLEENIEALKKMELKPKPINTRHPQNKPKKTAKPIKQTPAKAPAVKASATKVVPVKASKKTTKPKVEEAPEEVEEKAPASKVALTKAPEEN